MSSPLHFLKLWLVLGWLLIVVISILSLIPSLPTYQSTLNFLPNDIDKVGHVLAYFFLMGWFAQIYHLPKQRLWLVGNFVVLGLMLELLQGLTGTRHPSLIDAFANNLGILIAWIITKDHCQFLLTTFEQKYLLKS
jgi:VanZ family protein